MSLPATRLFITYDAAGLALARALGSGQNDHVCSFRELRADDLPQPQAGGTVTVYPVLMQSGSVAREMIPARLNELYLTLGQTPEIMTMPVFGTALCAGDHWLPESVKVALQQGSTLVIMAHPVRGKTPPEPHSFAENLRRLYPGCPVIVDVFGPEGNVDWAAIPTRHVTILPFLIGEGKHFHNDMPDASPAALAGKEMTLLPPLGHLILEGITRGDLPRKMPDFPASKANGDSPWAGLK